MVSKRRPRMITIAFLLTFGFSFVANEYVGGGLYGFPADTIMTLLVLGSATIILIVSVVRSIGNREVEWMLPAIAICSLIAAELIWRWLIAPDIDESKLTALGIFTLKPLVAALGVGAVFAESRRLVPKHEKVSRH